MEEEAIRLLKQIISSKEISLYTLVEIQARNKKIKSEDAYSETIRLIYLLASNNLIELKTTEGEDGSETIVRPTTFGETYCKSEAMEKRLKQ
jgi:hypothetical protein